MSRNNVLYLVIGALVVVAAVLGYNLYQDRKEPKGLQIPAAVRTDEAAA